MGLITDRVQYKDHDMDWKWEKEEGSTTTGGLKREAKGALSPFMGKIREKNEQRNKLFGQPLVIFL